MVGLALLALSFFDLRSTVEHPGVQGLLPVGGAILTIAAGPNNWANRHILSRRSMVFVGLISYPLYLWHWPLISFSHLVLGNAFDGWIAAGMILASVVLSFLTYRFAELPVRTRPINARNTLALCAGVLICGLVGYLTATQRIPARSRSLEVMRLERAGEDWLTGSPGSPWTPVVPEFIAVGDGPREVLYIGDSFMQHYFPRLKQLLKDHPHNAHRVILAARASCAPLIEVGSPFGRRACVEHGRKALEYAHRATVDVVVVGSSWVYDELVHVQNGKLVANTGFDGAVAPLRMAIESLRNEGKDVYIVLVSPFHGDLNPRSMIRRTIVGPGFTVAVPPEPLRRDIESYSAAINDKLIQLAKGTGANFINPVNSLCNSTTCPSLSRAGEPIYVEGRHIRPTYAMTNVLYLDETLIRGPDRLQ